MGTTVLDGNIPAPANVYSYAHCLRGRPGGVALLVVNADRQHRFDIDLPAPADCYTLSAQQLEDTSVQLNGSTLRLTPGGDLPALTGQRVKAGRVSFAPASITFLAVDNARSKSCR